MLLQAALAHIGRRGVTVLDVAPHVQIRRLLRARAGVRYVGIDRFEARAVDVWSDLTRLPFKSDAFDLIVCYHVLEHVPDDAAAIAELRRVLATGGCALVQVPFREGRPTDEDPDAPEEERIRRFGQADHVRWYGDDFVDRLGRGGFAVTSVRPREVLSVESLQRLSIRPDELVWLCCRAEDASTLPGLVAGLRHEAVRGVRRSSGTRAALLRAVWRRREGLARHARRARRVLSRTLDG